MELWAGQGDEAEYLTALKMVVLQLPSGSFPREDTPLHPLLLKQLSRLQDRSFLEMLCRRIASSDSDSSMATVCVRLSPIASHCTSTAPHSRGRHSTEQY
jgi:hypothetical protein